MVKFAINITFVKWPLLSSQQVHKSIGTRLRIRNIQINYNNTWIIIRNTASKLKHHLLLIVKADKKRKKKSKIKDKQSHQS